MPSLPDMNGDVYFGFTSSLPDWRKEPIDADEDEDEVTEEEKQVINAMLGFDVRELNEIALDESEDV